MTDRTSGDTAGSSMPGPGADSRVPDSNVVLPRPAAGDPRAHEHPSVQAPLSAGMIVLIVAATFGAGMATIVPMAFSLSIRVAQIAPGHIEVLGYLLGIGSACALVAAPLTGVLSDRTRSRWGRRRPFTVIGLAVGLTAVPVLAFAPSIPVLAVGWVLSTVGWGTAAGSIGNLQADLLPANQRGKVSGLSNVATQLAPVVGILVVGPVAADPLLLILIPAAIGTVLVALIAVLGREPDTRGAVFADRLSLGRVLGSVVFNPRRYPDFAWQWLGRFVFFFGLTFTTSFTTYFAAQRIGVPIEAVAPALATMSALSIVSATLGALGIGWLSDRTGRRRVWIAIGIAVFAAGTVVSAFAWGFPMVLAGSLISSLGISAFGSVGQALTLDVLPARETQAGRYLAINAFSQKLPSALAPLAAPVVITLTSNGGTEYTTLYLLAAALAVAGGLIILLKVKGAR